MPKATCQIEIAAILHVKFAQNYVSDRSSKNFPCKELQNICTGRKKLMIVKKVGAVNRGALRNPHRNTAKVRGHLL